MFGIDLHVRSPGGNAMASWKCCLAVEQATTGTTTIITKHLADDT
jgi:ClpP class serine protease